MGEGEQVYDLVILGAGPAGLTAGIYASRLGLKTVILESGIPGGRAGEAPFVENFPGFPDGIAGLELVERMVKQCSKFGAEIRTFEEAIDLELKTPLKKVTTRKGSYSSLSVIIATGTQRRKLRIPGESEFLGRGVSYCPVCDGAFFKGLRVVVVGSSDEAAVDALFLSDLASEVVLVTHGAPLEAAEDLLRKIREKGVKVVEARATEITGRDVVEHVKVAYKDGREDAIPIDGVFISLGGVPTSELVRKAGVEVDEKGCIKVDRMQRTNVEGVFAAGDCTCGGMQVVTAAGEGAMAAISASRYVKKVKRSS
ncbi:MAG: FAD-dependent oxidoreductase [Candidatus Jordarchaeales archaeon]